MRYLTSTIVKLVVLGTGMVTLYSGRTAFAEAKGRIVHFPENRSMGMLYVLDSDKMDRTQRPTAEEVLERYERANAVMREKVSFIAELEQTFNGAFKYKAKKRTYRRVVHRDGTRFGVSREAKCFDDQNKIIDHSCLMSIHGIEKAMITQNPYGQPPEHLRIDFRPKSFMDRLQELMQNSFFTGGFEGQALLREV